MTRITWVIHLIVVFIWLICVGTLIVQVWCIAFEEVIVLFRQYEIIWIPKSNTDSELLSK